MKNSVAASFVFALILVLGAEKASSDPLNPTAVGKARFTVLTEDCIRMEYSDTSKFVDAPSLFASHRLIPFVHFKATQTPTQTIIETARLQLTYTPDGHGFSDGNLKVIVHDVKKGDMAWTPSLKNKQNLGGTRNNLDKIDGAVPVNDGLLSRDGWYVIDDSQRFVVENNWVAKRPQGAGVDWYFFGYGIDYKGALRSLTKVSGEVPLPRRHVLGSWYSRWWPYTSGDYRQIVQEFHDHDFPLDNLVMDMDWHKTNSWTGYTWNRKLFPDAENYLRWIHDQHLFATLNDHPQNGIGPYEERYGDFMQALGKDPRSGEILGYNSGDQKYLTTLFKFMHEPLEKAGVDFWWLDWMGDDKFVFNRIDWVNQFYYNHSKRNGLRGQQFSRWADWGDHRHPIHFSGDTHVSWPMLAFEIPFTAQSGNAGAFFWSHDIGGFEGTRNGELLARWTQFGAFSAALRLHSTKARTLDKRPWTYIKNQTDAMRVAFHLRSIFFPYTYSRVWEASRDSVPLIRPLYIENPELEDSYHHPQEYLYGADVLVAPIVTPGKGAKKVASQNVYFPPGIWYDWFSGNSFQGGVTKTFEHGLETFPLFVRGGIPLTLQPYTERMTTDPLKTLVIRLYPGIDGQEGKSTLYEDDGLTESYKKGESAQTELRSIRVGSKTEIEISPTVGTFSGQLGQRNYVFELFGVKATAKVAVNVGTPVVQFDSVQHILKISVLNRDIRSNLKINIEAQE